MTTTGKASARRRAARGSGSSAPPSERRDDIVRLAAGLFAEKGYQATTVRNIADRAGILSGSLYHHFDSKESIVDEILTSFCDELTAAGRAALEEGDDPREILAALVRVCFRSLVPHRAAIMVLQNDGTYLRRFERFGYLARFEEETERMWVGQIARGRETGLFRDDIDPHLTYRMVRDTIWVAVRWFRPGGRLDTQGLADHYVGILFDGIAVR